MDMKFFRVTIHQWPIDDITKKVQFNGPFHLLGIQAKEGSAVIDYLASEKPDVDGGLIRIEVEEKEL